MYRPLFLKQTGISFLVNYKSRIVNGAILLMSIICFYSFCDLILNYPKPEAIWQLFGDCEDYLEQSRHSLWSKDLYMPAQSPGFSPRPFTVPLFYKLAGSEPYAIIRMQKIVYCLSVLVFVNSILILLKNKLVKLIALPFLYFFFNWWIIVGFTENLLSESLSMSFLFLWIASLILCIRFKKIYLLILVMVISTLFSFTRDTWPYIILLANVILLGLFYKHKTLRNYFIALSIYSTAVFLFQSHTATVGERYKIPIYNVLATRISKNPEYIAWFANKGMPLGDSLRIHLRHVNPEKRETISKLYDSYTNPHYEPVFKWIMKEGKSAYVLFMLTHPSYFFLSDQTAAEKERIFTTADHDYYLKAKGYYHEIEAIFPFFSLSFLIWSTVILFILALALKPDSYWSLFPGFLLILFTVNVFLSYNTDTLEVKRHLFITQVMIQLLSIVTSAVLADVILGKAWDLIVINIKKQK